MKKLPLYLCLSSLVFTFSCTEPGETTGLGAAAGGALGAGVGAIVGSTSGDAGAGLAIGAVTGAATGALVGNVIEGERNSYSDRRTTIARQDRQIASQQTEISQLRKLGEDSVKFKGDSRGVPSSHDSRIPSSYASTNATQVAPVRQGAFNGGGFNRVPVLGDGGSRPIPVQRVEDGSMILNSDTSSTSTISSVPSSRSDTEPSNLESVNLHPKEIQPPANQQSKSQEMASMKPVSGECVEAEGEIAQANSKIDNADRLFHYRRALRLCPNNPSYHVGLGDIYLSLNRTEDAKYEFNEALKIDPGFQEAKNRLSSQGSNRY